ncbi:hypothetical protein DENSPDRAFT_841269 [Dentipellis sp. KUC8613]|nr:hypothetical protein DENSPDRAFT_841269 [Dentipellis sp. KUC8613]
MALNSRLALLTAPCSGYCECWSSWCESSKGGKGAARAVQRLCCIPAARVPSGHLFSVVLRKDTVLVRESITLIEIYLHRVTDA